MACELMCCCCYRMFSCVLVGSHWCFCAVRLIHKNKSCASLSESSDASLGKSLVECSHGKPQDWSFSSMWSCFPWPNIISRVKQGIPRNPDETGAVRLKMKSFVRFLEEKIQTSVVKSQEQSGNIDSEWFTLLFSPH